MLAPLLRRILDLPLQVISVFFYTFGIYIQRPIYNLFIILFIDTSHPNCMSTVMHEQNYKTNLQIIIFISGYLFVQQQTNLFIEFIKLFTKQSNINLT